MITIDMMGSVVVVTYLICNTDETKEPHKQQGGPGQPGHPGEL